MFKGTYTVLFSLWYESEDLIPILDDNKQKLAHLLTFWTRTIARSSYIRDSRRRARHSFQKKYEGEFRVRERYSVKSNQMA